MTLDMIKKVWKEYKFRITAATIVVVILAISTGIVTRYCLQKKVQIAQVFMDSEVMVSTGSVEIAGEYITKSLSDRQKAEVIIGVADRIGLNLEAEDFQYGESDRVKEVAVHRISKGGDTLIKMVSINVNAEGEIPVINNYLLIRIELRDNIESVQNYQALIEKEFKKLEITNDSSYIQFTGKYPGMLTLESKNALTNRMIKTLGGRITFENRADDFYTVYGYSGGIKDYISVGKGKVNIQVAMNYDELHDETVIHLATPILNGSY